MSKQASLDKVRDTLVKLRESIDNAEQRYDDAKYARTEAISRLEKAEEEADSVRRRLQLLQTDLEKANKTLAEKEDRLGHVEGRSIDDDEKRREFEGIEVERDDHLISIEEEALTAKQQAQEHTHLLMEAQRKVVVLEGDLEKVYQRCEVAEGKEKSHLDVIERNGEELRSLEDRDNDAAEREVEAEEKLRFLEGQLKEAVARAEGAERDVVRNENIIVSVKGDMKAVAKKREKVDKEIQKMEDLVSGLVPDDADDDDEPKVEQEHEPESEPEEQAEPEPEEEPEEED